MNREHSLQQSFGIWVLAACMFILAAGAAHAQVVIIENDEISIEAASGETVRLSYGGDLFLGGNGFTGEIYVRTPSDDTVGRWVASGIWLGGGTSPGSLTLRDDDGLSKTIQLFGQYGHILLGGNGSDEDGDITVLMGDGTHSFEVDGASGNVTNIIKGNGLVKAWARINADGTIASCWRCNTSTSETQRVSGGRYEVDFTFASDIRNRPRLAVIDTHDNNNYRWSMITLADRVGDTSTVYVSTADVTPVVGVLPPAGLANRPFTLVIY